MSEAGGQRPGYLRPLPPTTVLVVTKALDVVRTMRIV